MKIRHRWTSTARSAHCAPSSKSGRMSSWSTKAPTRSISRAALSTSTNRADAWTSAPGRHGRRDGLCHRSRRRDWQARARGRRRQRLRFSAAWKWKRFAGTSCRFASSSSTITASIAEPTPIPPAARPCDDRLYQRCPLRQDHRSIRRRWPPCDDARRAESRREQGHGLRSTDPHQRGDRPAAGTESGRIGNLNPQSALRKK